MVPHTCLVMSILLPRREYSMVGTSYLPVFCVSIQMKGQGGLLKKKQHVYFCTGFMQQGFGSRGGFCEKPLDTSPLSDRGKVNWLQDGPATGQHQAHQ